MKFAIDEYYVEMVAQNPPIGQTTNLWVDQNNLYVQIEDQGKGFDPNVALEASDTVGLAGIQERVRLVGGHYALEAAPGSGTSMLAEFPTDNPLKAGVAVGSD